MVACLDSRKLSEVIGEGRLKAVETTHWVALGDKDEDTLSPSSDGCGGGVLAPTSQTQAEYS